MIATCPSTDSANVRRRTIEPMIGEHPSIVELRAAVERAALAAGPVLIQGQTGSGKELVAELLHASSGQRGKLVPVNLATIPEQLIDAELFGAERGAYTGLTGSRDGLVQQATNGTLYLDEAGDISAAIQLKLLRAVEAGAFRRLGATADRQVDFRLVVSTQEEPQELVRSGRWRPDFYYRVAGIVLRVPSLRERLSDVPILADHFLQQQRRPPLRPAAAELLMTHPWHGNVRELRRVIERAAFLSVDGSVTEADIRRALDRSHAVAPVPVGSAHRSLAAVERAHILSVLTETDFDTLRAAAILGISRRTLYRRIEVLGIVRPVSERCQK